MKIRIQNYEIEQDRNGCILTTYKIAEKWDNIWEEYVADQVYPSSLQKALEKVADKIKDKDITLDISNLLEYIKKENEVFIAQIKEAKLKKAKKNASKVAKEKQV